MKDINPHIHLAIEDIDPPKNLELKILQKIETVIERKNRNRKIIGFSFFSLSIVSCIGLIVYTVRAFEQSGFSAYSSLLFSDSKLVLANFGQFALSLIDSLPFFAITMMLASVLVILVSMQYMTNSKKELSYTF